MTSPRVCNEHSRKDNNNPLFCPKDPFLAQILVPFDVVQQFFVLCRTLRVRNAHPTPLVGQQQLSVRHCHCCHNTDTRIVHNTQQSIMMLALHDDQTGNEMVAELN